MIDAPAPSAMGRHVSSPRFRHPPGWPVWAAVAATVAAGATVYLRAYRIHGMRPVGWDIFGYIWQTKAIGHVPLSDVGARPAVPALGAVLRSAAHLPPDQAMVILPIVLAVALGLAAAGTVRSALGLTPWLVPVLVGAVLLWPGTARTLVGYEASLLLLVVLAAAVGVLVQSRGRHGALLLTGTLLLAACLSHVAIFAVFVVVTALFVALSGAAFLRDRRAGVPVLATDAGGAVAAVLMASAAGALTLFGALGVRPGDSVHTQSVSFLFRQRTVEEVRRIRPWVTWPAAAIGSASAMLATIGPHAGGGTPDATLHRPARALVRLGLAWLVVAGAGVALSLRGSSVPGGRFLLFALPLPVLVGLGLGTGAWLLASGRWGLRAVVAALLVAGILGGLARPGYRFIQYQYTQVRVALADQLAVAAAYVRGLPGSPPVVVVVDQPGPSGAYTPKLRQNVIRTAMPEDTITRTFVFVGRTEDLLAGRPTLLPETTSWRRTYDRTSRQAWEQVRPALAQGAVVLVLDVYDRAAIAPLVAADPSRLIAPGVYVLRGPVDITAVPARAPGLGTMEAAAIGLWWLVVLSLVGWGFARAALPRERASALDVACLSPAVGAGVVVPVVLCVAAAGADPAGPIGVVVLAVAAVLGAVVLRRSRARAERIPADA